MKYRSKAHLQKQGGVWKCMWLGKVAIAITAKGAWKALMLLHVF